MPRKRRAPLPPPIDETRQYAINGALMEIERILRLFPELRGRVTLADGVIGSDDDPHARAVRKHALAHWKNTRAATNGHAPTPSLRTRLRGILTTTPQTSKELIAALLAAGYQHVGVTPLSSRVPQEAGALIKQGEVRKTKDGYRLKGDASS